MIASSAVGIRHASSTDASALRRLMGQLGYPAPETNFSRRVTAVLAEPQHVVLVAEREGAVIGLVHVARLSLLEDDAPAQLLALVVDEAHRGAGIGAQLVAAAENWAAARGCPRIVVRSNSLRTRTHEFYDRLGYERKKTQLNFSKTLPAAAP